MKWAPKSGETDISSSSVHRLDMTLAVAEEVNPNELKNQRCEFNEYKYMYQSGNTRWLHKVPEAEEAAASFDSGAGKHKF